MTQEDAPKQVCARCGTTKNIFEPEEQKVVHCNHCLVELVDHKLERENETRMAAALEAAARWGKLFSGLLVLCAIVVLIVQFPALHSTFQHRDPAPLHRPRAIRPDRGRREALHPLLDPRPVDGIPDAS